MGSREAHWEPWLPKLIPQDSGASVWSQDYAVSYSQQELCDIPVFTQITFCEFFQDWYLLLGAECLSLASSYTRFCQARIQLLMKPWPCLVRLPSWIPALPEHRLTRAFANHRALPWSVLPPLPSVPYCSPTWPFTSHNPIDLLRLIIPSLLKFSFKLTFFCYLHKAVISFELLIFPKYLLMALILNTVHFSLVFVSYIMWRDMCEILL